jgi:hypothetical protein
LIVRQFFMSPEDAVARLNELLAHAWMVRTFLKHADEIQDSPDMLAVPRTLYDTIRAVEPAFQRGDHVDYLRRLTGKLPKLRRAAAYFGDHFREFSPHTNFEMAAASLHGVVRAMDDVFARVDVAALPPKAAAPAADPPDELDIPEV